MYHRKVYLPIQSAEEAPVPLKEQIREGAAVIKSSRSFKL